MDPEWRQLFDEQVELVLAQLPQEVHDFMRDVPMIVEDYPSREQQNRLHQIVSHVGETCALTNPRNIPLVRRTTVR